MIRILLSFILLCFSLFSSAQGDSDSVFHKSSYSKIKYTDNSVLAQGEWYRIRVKQEGIYIISHSDLVQEGIDLSSVNPKNIKIYGNGGAMLPEGNWQPCSDDLVENAIYVSGENDGSFDEGDYILFFGQSSTKWTYDTLSRLFFHTTNIYSDYTYYFLNIGTSTGKRISASPSLPVAPDFELNSFIDYEYHEKDTVNLLRSGKEWFGECFDISNTYSFQFDFPNLVLSDSARVRTSLAARSLEQTTFNITNDGTGTSINISAIPGSSNTDYARVSDNRYSFIPDDDQINVSIEKATENSVSWINFIEVNAERELNFTAPQMQFSNASFTAPGQNAEYRLSNSNAGIIIWDITVPEEITEQEYSLQSSNAVFISSADTLKKYLAFDGSDFHHPDFIEKVMNQNLHALASPDMVIVTHPLFETQAEKIAKIHETLDGFNVAIVTPQQIYNEYSSGLPDITAIRNFLRMFYVRSDSTGNYPKYLLLFGDATFDYKDRLPDNLNLVPTYQSTNSLVPVSSYLTDDYFGILDSTEGYFSNGELDMGIGRLPAKTAEEAETLVNKIVTYLSHDSASTENSGCHTYTVEAQGDWRNNICFVADDEDNNLHLEQAENLAAIIDTAYNDINLKKIYLDAYPQMNSPQGASYPQVTEAINDMINDGVLIVNYTGHGGETGWAIEKIIQVADIENWTNLNKLSVFVTATCEFSRFDEPSRYSAGELVLLNAKGGGIALFTTTRVSFAYSNFNLNKSFCQEVLKKDSNNRYMRFGDIIRKSKIDNGSIVNIRNFVLLGDPALRLSFPENNVITSEINGHAVDSVPDTIKAGGTVNIKGYLQDNAGNVMTGFNGFVFPTVFDRKISLTTLANDPNSSPFDFSSQEKIIFKGKSTVTNGEFEFSFKVPVSISPDFGEARISYYASNDSVNATGFYESPGFIIGGNDSTAMNDNEGPVIKLYFNDTTFVSGVNVDVNPIFMATIEDTSGIQYTGYGIGHDIVACLDGKTESEYILNDFFIPETDSYTKGSILFPFTSLSEGIHTISLKAWDIFDNSSESSTIFITTKPGNFSFKNVFNFPNPFTENTCFYFEHNQPCCELDVELNIYDIRGILVKTIREPITTNGLEYSTLCWNGRNDFGEKLHSGVYVYRLKITSGNGSWLETSNRLIIFNHTK